MEAPRFQVTAMEEGILLQMLILDALCSVRSFLLLVVRPGAPSSVPAPSSDARSP